MKSFLEERLQTSSFITNMNNDNNDNTDIAEALVYDGSIVISNVSQENGNNKS